MSSDYQKLGLPPLRENNFSQIPSRSHLTTILELDEQMAQIEKVSFEWLELEDSKQLLEFLQRNGASSFFKHHETDSIKLNMLEWLAVYNLLLLKNNKSNLNAVEKNLLLKFVERFEMLIEEHPIDTTLVKTFEKDHRQNTKQWKLFKKSFQWVCVLCALLILANIYLESEILQWLIPVIMLSGFISIYIRENLIKAEVSNYVVCCMYSQMLVDHSY